MYKEFQTPCGRCDLGPDAGGAGDEVAGRMGGGDCGYFIFKI
jgi:hypothetical protein